MTEAKAEQEEIIDYEDIKEIDKEVGLAKEKRRRRRTALSDSPDLSDLRGTDVIEILNFLHKRYLEWMTEAESAKYSTLFKSARDEALKDMLDVYNQIQSQQTQLMNKLTELINKLEGKVTVQQPAVQQGVFFDDRFKTLLFLLADMFFDSSEKYRDRWRKYRTLVLCNLVPSLCQEQVSES